MRNSDELALEKISRLEEEGIRVVKHIDKPRDRIASIENEIYGP